MGNCVKRAVTLRKSVSDGQYTLTKLRWFGSDGVHRNAKSLYFDPVKRQTRIHTHMCPKPASSCPSRAPEPAGVGSLAGMRLNARMLVLVSCLGVGTLVAAPALAWEVGAGETVVEQEPVVDARAQRRANLRRALVEGSGRTAAGTQARPMSRDERDMLNRELREVMRSAYDEYTLPAQ